MNVVVVDDDPLVRLVLARAVASMGHVSLPAENGDAALHLVETKSVDVVVSDWMMPGMTGLELCQLIRARSRVTSEPAARPSLPGTSGTPPR